MLCPPMMLYIQRTKRQNQPGNHQAIDLAPRGHQTQPKDWTLPFLFAF